MPDFESGGKDVDLDARGDNGLAVGLDGVVGLLKGECGMAAAAHTNCWQDVYKRQTHVGDKVQVKVMEIDLDRRRISLSMKSAAETLGVEIEVTPLPSEKKDEETDAE